jgi:G-protein alpha subunit
MSQARKIGAGNGCHILVLYTDCRKEPPLLNIYHVTSFIRSGQPCLTKAVKEDPDLNRFDDSLQCFSDIMAHKILAAKPTIVLFNKYDLFLQKCRQIKFSDYRAEYKGSNEPSEIIRHFEAQLHSRNTPHDDQKRYMTFHVTTATDTTLMKKIIQDVVKFVLSQTLSKLGMA